MKNWLWGRILEDVWFIMVQGVSRIAGSAFCDLVSCYRGSTTAVLHYALHIRGVSAILVLRVSVILHMLFKAGQVEIRWRVPQILKPYRVSWVHVGAANHEAAARLGNLLSSKGSVTKRLTKNFRSEGDNSAEGSASGTAEQKYGWYS